MKLFSRDWWAALLIGTVMGTGLACLIVEAVRELYREHPPHSVDECHQCKQYEIWWKGVSRSGH